MDITEHLRTFMAQQTGLSVTPLLEQGLVAAIGPGNTWALTEAGYTMLNGEGDTVLHSEHYLEKDRNGPRFLPYDYAAQQESLNAQARAALDLPTHNPGDWVTVDGDHTQAADEDWTDSFLRKHVKPGAQSQQIGDSVNHPAHYTHGGIECIDAIEAALTEEEFRGYCKGNALKYIWRERHKGGAESLAKAVWYLGRLSNEHL